MFTKVNYTNAQYVIHLNDLLINFITQKAGSQHHHNIN